MRRHQQHNNCSKTEEAEDYHTYVKHLEKKTSMMHGPHFGNMQHVFKRVEVYEEVDDQECEGAGRFGRSKQFHGRNHNHNNSCEEKVDTESTEFIRSKHEYLVRAP